jgi:hypothetical protein
MGLNGTPQTRALAAAAAGAGMFIALVGAVPAIAAPPPKGWVAGWSTPNSKFIGRYRLASSVVSNPSMPAGTTTGELTLFLQTTYAGSTPVPAGIISLHTAQSTTVVYLTDLDHTGTTLKALVHGGSFVAPATGRFILSRLSGGEITGTLTDAKLAKRVLTFKRFSKRTQ